MWRGRKGIFSPSRLLLQGKAPKLEAVGPDQRQEPRPASVAGAQCRGERPEKWLQKWAGASQTKHCWPHCLFRSLPTCHQRVRVSFRLQDQTMRQRSARKARTQVAPHYRQRKFIPPQRTASLGRIPKSIPGGQILYQ